jgi:hypothetical protein
VSKVKAHAQRGGGGSNMEAEQRDAHRGGVKLVALVVEEVATEVDVPDERFVEVEGTKRFEELREGCAAEVRDAGRDAQLAASLEHHRRPHPDGGVALPERVCVSPVLAYDGLRYAEAGAGEAARHRGVPPPVSAPRVRSEGLSYRWTRPPRVHRYRRAPRRARERRAERRLPAPLPIVVRGRSAAALFVSVGAARGGAALVAAPPLHLLRAVSERLDSAEAAIRFVRLRRRLGGVEAPGVHDHAQRRLELYGGAPRGVARADEARDRTDNGVRLAHYRHVTRQVRVGAPDQRVLLAAEKLSGDEDVAEDAR